MGLYRQMVGRVLRPADGKGDATSRITSHGRSIPTSDQPAPGIRRG
jgi:superfamily II DNA or RNA helicase